MSNVRIVADDGAECTVTLLVLSKRLADDSTFFDVLGDLITTQKANVTLMDGRSADVLLLGPEDGFHPLSEQPALPLREYQADAQLMFELPGRVRVRASSPEKAQSIITDVVRRNRPAPPGFSIGIDGDAVDNFSLKLEAAMADGRHNRTLDVRDVHLTNLIERRLLGGPAS